MSHGGMADSHVFVYTFKVNRTSFVVCIVIF